jgi:hypothetical protein
MKTFHKREYCGLGKIFFLMPVRAPHAATKRKWRRLDQSLTGPTSGHRKGGDRIDTRGYPIDRIADPPCNSILP